MGLTIRRRPLTKIIIAVALATGFIAGLNSGLLSCAPESDKAAARPLTGAELNRLASMRSHNFSDGRVGVRGTVGRIGSHTSIDGWVDWRRKLIYLSVYSTATRSTAMVQARPGVLAIRPDPGAGDSQGGPGKPPAVPPADGWRVRPLTLAEDSQAPLDNLIAFLFLIAQERPDRADLLGSLDNEWVRTDTVQGVEVDVLLGPAVIPGQSMPSPAPSASAAPDPASLETHGGAVGYWLDAEGRLRKVETLLAAEMPTAIEFLRDDRREFRAVDALGGRDIEPREVTDAEADLLALMRQRNYHARGMRISLTLPALPGNLRRGSGWLDWRRGIAYLTVRDLDEAGKSLLVHANRTGVSLREPQDAAAASPPLPAPAGAWERSEWGQLTENPKLTDVDLILFEVMSMSINQPDDAQRMKASARLLRVDALGDDPVGVFELPNSVEQKWAPGTARVRYWVDNSGVLRRLEMVTRTGGLAQLDLTPAADLPDLPVAVQ